MQIESVILRNFQCFGDQRNVIELEPDLTAFIGTNGAGKTAACQALQRLFGITNADRAVRLSDFHVPADEDDVPQSRHLVVEAILAFPELEDENADGNDAVPEFFHRMAADTNGTLKCRIVLEATWTADGTADGSLESRYWIVHTFEENYSAEECTVLPPTERARIQMIYVPAARDGVRHVTAFLRSRLWQAAKWSGELHDLVETTAKQVSERFHKENATATVEAALGTRWHELHGTGNYAKPRFQPVAQDVVQLLRGTELVFGPDHVGTRRSAEMLSDGQRSLLHLALTVTSLDIEAGLIGNPQASNFDLTAVHLPALTLLVIEEPENSLSPFYLSRIISQVLSISQGARAQAVLASHSPSVLNRVQPENIRYFRLETEVNTANVRAISLPDDSTEAGKYVREAVRAHPELYFARFVVLGEGDTEELVIPRIAQARGVELDPSFVAMVPLGGRHTNHFWRLLNDLGIPHATLLDLDYGRADAGPTRLRTASKLLAEFGVDVFAGLASYKNADALTDDMPAFRIAEVQKHLRQFGIFFSAPLDLDMSMLVKFGDAYTTLEEGELGPRNSDATEAVIGTGGHPSAVAYWKPTNAAELERQQGWLRWYRYLFLNRSKPSTHLRALARIPDEQLLNGPEELIALIDFIKEKAEL